MLQFEELFEEHYEELYDMRPVEHPPQERPRDEPLIFIAPIASANILLKDEILRNRLRKKKAKAVEMESAGVVTACKREEKNFISIRGICDYCNWKKDDEWQEYAAIVAAGFTIAFIEILPSDLKVDPVILSNRDLFFNLIGLILIILIAAGIANLLKPDFFLFILYLGFLIFYLFLLRYTYDYWKRYRQERLKQIMTNVLGSLFFFIPVISIFVRLFYINQDKIPYFIFIMVVFSLLFEYLYRYKPFNRIKILYILLVIAGIMSIPYILR
ncbi:MAG: hypothetical protein CEE43_19005 [Promethearchaeota archaeon Loki_b32]|nr:MAG: hypothetical protein CEE43_19005 [Candidatus Lokiarchaeota archaeon Loki_b32]